MAPRLRAAVAARIRPLVARALVTLAALLALVGVLGARWWMLVAAAVLAAVAAATALRGRAPRDSR